MTRLESLLHGLPVADLFKDRAYIPVNITSDRTRLVDIESVEALHRFVFSQFDSRAGEVGAGGYLEERKIYGRRETAADFAIPDGEPRTVHLGVDFWTDAGTPVYAPVSGRIHSKGYNPGMGQFGGCIILAHDVEGQRFHTLYGHLSLKSLACWEENEEVPGGQMIGQLGEPAENGWWPPHLHFQVVAGMQNFQGDYYAVSARSQLAFYCRNCPDPNLLLKINYNSQAVAL